MQDKLNGAVREASVAHLFNANDLIGQLLAVNIYSHLLSPYVANAGVSRCGWLRKDHPRVLSPLPACRHLYDRLLPQSPCSRPSLARDASA